ncbi:MAG: SufE family protein [Alphaproteobacteria bacterium]|nr:SufE family protein [Alphaproteobacteria bacterium]
MDIDEIVETFEALDPGEDRYRFLIELGKDLPGLPDEAKVESHRVHGCQSRVWMVAGVDEQGHLALHADSDAFLVRGLIAVLLATYAGLSPAQAVDVDPLATFARIGLEQQLSMGRRNGLHSMVQRIRALAAANA